MGEPCLIMGSESRHVSLEPEKYLCLSTWKLQEGFVSNKFQRSFAPIAKFWIFKSLIWRAPSIEGNLIFFQLTRENLFPPLFFPPCQRKDLSRISILARILEGASKIEHCYNGKLFRTTFINTIFPVEFSQTAPQAWIFFLSLSISGFQSKVFALPLNIGIHRYLKESQFVTPSIPEMRDILDISLGFIFQL